MQQFCETLPIAFTRDGVGARRWHSFRTTRAIYVDVSFELW